MRSTEDTAIEALMEQLISGGAGDTGPVLARLFDLVVCFNNPNLAKNDAMANRLCGLRATIVTRV